jgi:hypothetical protein
VGRFRFINYDTLYRDWTAWLNDNKKLPNVALAICTQMQLSNLGNACIAPIKKTLRKTK